MKCKRFCTARKKQSEKTSYGISENISKPLIKRLVFKTFKNFLQCKSKIVIMIIIIIQLKIGKGHE